MVKKVLVLALFISFYSNLSNAAVLDQESRVISAANVKKHNFSLSFVSVASVANMKAGKIGPENISDRMIDSYNYLGLNYKLDETTKAAFHLPLLMSTEGVNDYGDRKPAKISLSDIHFVYSNNDLGYIGDFDLSGSVKFYLPTSPSSQAGKTIAKIRFEMFLNWQFERHASIEYVIKPDLYLQTQTAYFNADDIPMYEDGSFVRDPRALNKAFSLEHFVQLNYEINKYFIFASKTGFVEDWFYSSQVEQLDGGHATKVRAGIGLVLSPLKLANFTLSLQNDTPVAGKSGASRFFLPENTQYTLMTTAFIF